MKRIEGERGVRLQIILDLNGFVTLEQTVLRTDKEERVGAVQQSEHGVQFLCWPATVDPKSQERYEGERYERCDANTKVPAVEKGGAFRHRRKRLLKVA